MKLPNTIRAGEKGSSQGGQNGARAPIPAGRYRVVIVDTRQKVTKAGADALVIELRVKLNDGQTRQLNQWLAYGASEQAEQMFHHFLQQLANATGIDCTDTDDFVGSRVLADIIVNEAGYNAVKKYHPLEAESQPAGNEGQNTPPAPEPTIQEGEW